MESAAQQAKEVGDSKLQQTVKLGSDVQRATATAGIPYVQRYVQRHIVANQRETTRMSEMRTITSIFAYVPVMLDMDGVIDINAHNRAFGLCHEAVAALGGLVNQYLWDDKGIILKAAWGLLRPTANDEKHATLCALRLVDALGDQARVGVASGWAFTGLVGAEGIRLGMVMFGADSVTLAARLMNAAKPGTVLVSSVVKRITEPFIVYDDTDEPPIPLKGRNRSELVCRPLRTRRVILDRITSHDPNRGFLVRSELESQIKGAMRESISEKSMDPAASVIVIQGNGGCGKSVLLHQLTVEFTKEASGRFGGVQADKVPEVCCISTPIHHSSTPYFVWRLFLHWALHENELRDDHFLSLRSSSADGPGDVLKKRKKFTRINSLNVLTRSAKVLEGADESDNRRALGEWSPFKAQRLKAWSARTLSTYSKSSQLLPKLVHESSAHKPSQLLPALVHESSAEKKKKSLPATSKLHDVIFSRINSHSHENCHTCMTATTGASSVDLAAAEMLFPTEDDSMAPVLENMTVEDWNVAHANIREAILSVVSSFTRPVILALDSAQHVDVASWMVIEWLASDAARAAKGKLMVLVAGLSAPEASKHHGARVRRFEASGRLSAAAPKIININSLTIDESKDLIKILLGVKSDEGETVAPSLESYILGQSLGNPRDTVILVDLLRRENLVDVNGETGVYDFLQDSSSQLQVHSTFNKQMSIPEGVRVALVSQIDMLSATEAEVLKCAGVIGAEFSVEILLKAVEHSLTDLLAILSVIQSRELIFEMMPGEFKFTHPLMAETAASLMMNWQREEMNALLASVYEMEADASNAFAAQRAMHYSRAGAENMIDAVRLYAIAAKEAESLDDYPLAGVHLAEAVALARSDNLVAPALPYLLAMAASNMYMQAEDKTAGLSLEEQRAMHAEGAKLASEALARLTTAEQENNEDWGGACLSWLPDLLDGATEEDFQKVAVGMATRVVQSVEGVP